MRPSSLPMRNGARRPASPERCRTQVDLPFERLHQRLDRRDMCLDACLDWKRLRRLDCVVHVGVMDREVNRLGPFGTVFKRTQFGNEIAPRDDTAARAATSAILEASLYRERARPCLPKPRSFHRPPPARRRPQSCCHLKPGKRPP